MMGHPQGPVSRYSTDIVLRGYDRRQVHEYLERLDGDSRLIADPPAFDVVWRGYDRHQVDEYIRLVLLERRGADEVPSHAGWWPFERSDETPVRPAFDVVLRGYDRRHIDAYLDLLESDPGQAERLPELPVAMRGYDRRQVEAYIAWCWNRWESRE